MPSRHSSTGSVSEGGLPPPPKRVKVKTQDSPNKWIVIPSFANNINQLTCYVRTRLSLSRDEKYNLYLDGSVIPPEETIEFIRDGDEIHVYPSGKAAPPQESPSSNSTLSKPRRVRSAEGRRRRNARNRQREKRRRQEARDAKATASMSNSASIAAAHSHSEQQVSITTLKPTESQPRPAININESSSEEMKKPPPNPLVTKTRSYRKRKSSDPPKRISERKHNDLEHEQVEESLANPPALRPEVTNPTSRVVRTQRVSTDENKKNFNARKHQSESKSFSSPDVVDFKVNKNPRANAGARRDAAHTPNRTINELYTSCPNKSSSRFQKPCPKSSQPKQSHVIARGERAGQFGPEMVVPDSSDMAQQMKAHAASLVDEVLETVIEGSHKWRNNHVKADKPHQKRYGEEGISASASHSLLANNPVRDRKVTGISSSIQIQELSNKTKSWNEKDGTANFSEPRLPSSISLSIAASEVHLAKELNPVVSDNQHNLPGDVNAAIDDILEVLDKDKIGNSSPTAVVNTVIEDSNNDEIVKERNDGSIFQQTPFKGEKARQREVDFGAVKDFKLVPAASTKAPRSLKRETGHNGSGCLQSEKGCSAVVHGKIQKPVHVVTEPVQMRPSKEGDTVEIQCPADDQEPNVPRSDGVLGLSHFMFDLNVHSSTLCAKRRRKDIEYTFSASKTGARPLLPSLQDSHTKKQVSNETTDEKSKPSDTDNQSREEVKSKFLDDILDLEKGVDIKFLEIEQSQISSGGQEKVSMDFHPIRTEGNSEPDIERVGLGPTVVQLTEKFFEEEEDVNKRGAVHSGNPEEDENLIRMKTKVVNEVTGSLLTGKAQSGEELVKENGYTKTGKTATKNLNTARTQAKISEPRPQSSTGKRGRSTLSVSSALRFARKQKMLQEGNKEKNKSFEQDVHVQESLCSSPKPKKRKKKKKKKKGSSPLEAKEMISERQYNESVFLGFENDSEKLDMQAEAEEDKDFMLPPPSLLESPVDMRDPSLFTCPTPEEGEGQLPSRVEVVESQGRLNGTEALSFEGHAELGATELPVNDGLPESHKTASNRTKKFGAKDLIRDLSRLNAEDDGNLLKRASDDRRSGSIRTAHGALAKEPQVVEYERSAHVSLPPPVIEVEEETLNQNDKIATLEVMKERHSSVRRGKKDDSSQKHVLEQGTATILGGNSGRRPLLPDLEPMVPDGRREGKGTSQGESSKHFIDKQQECITFGREDQRAVFDFEEKRKFFDNMATLMIDTTVELEFFCEELFRVKSKTGDDCPS